MTYIHSNLSYKYVHIGIGTFYKYLLPIIQYNMPNDAYIYMYYGPT